MKARDFLPDSPGRLVTTRTGYLAFVPNPLPPGMGASWPISAAVSDAERALADLGRVLTALPSPEILVAPFVRREATLSSRIEGTRASLADLLEFEADNVERAGSDVGELAKYVAALRHGVDRLQTLPLSLRFIRELHGVLLADAGSHLTPGEFRRSQNWIGPPGSTISTATFVPPPPDEMMEALGELGSYLHAPSELPSLVRLALIHYQFEAIHPFLDGNGRVGRMLASLLLCVEGVVPAPVPYLSAFIDRHRSEYYRLLLAVSRRGAWDEWLDFFLKAIASESRDAVRRGKALLDLRSRQHATIGTGRATGNLVAAIDILVAAPIQTVRSLQRGLGVSNRTAQQTVARLLELGLIEESTGRRRNRIFVARGFLELLEADVV